ncbi:MAG: hypothetical protein HOP09_10985 [Hyphomicrobium sp.]|nr:hypothetical protein [Hyphomicrobium sp.]
MGIRGDGISFAALRRWVAHLLLFAFALRATVPVGYMPDFAAVAQGTFKVVICSSSMTAPVSIDLLDGIQTGKPGSHATDICAFSGIAALALPDLLSAPVETLEFAAITLTYPLAVHLPPVRAGPAHGARAPPKFS